MQSIEIQGSKFNPVVVASKPKEDWVKRNLKSHFPRLSDEDSATRLGEVHDACCKAVDTSATQEAAKEETKPATRTKQVRKVEPAL